MKKFMKALLQSALFGLAFCVLIMLVLIALYRIPAGSPDLIEGEIQYQMLDLGQGEPVRAILIEDILFRNRRVFLKSATTPWLYIGRDDFKKCWPEPIASMIDQNFTIKARFQAKKLWLINGYSEATLIDTFHIAKRPYITK